MARWVTAAVGLLALYFLADWLLDLPLGVRRFVRLGLLDRPEGLSDPSWMLLVLVALALTWWSTRNRLGAAPIFAFATAGIVGLLVWFGARLLQPLGSRLSDEDLALSVEDRFRALNDRLAASLDFEEELERPSRGESEAMMRAVLDEAGREAEHIEFARAASARRTLAWMGAALGAVLVAGAVAWAASDTVGLWAERSLLLEERAWPRATTMVAVDPTDADASFVVHPPEVPFEVVVGRPLVVHARAEGDVPDEVLLVHVVERGRPLPHRMFPVPDAEGMFQVEIRDVRRPFSFVLRGGDDVDDEPVYTVEISVPPRVLAIRAALTFPDYLGREPTTVEGGNLTVPEGTHATVTFETDVPVERASVYLGDAVVEANALDTDDDGQARRFTFAFDAVETLRYRVLLRTKEGRESDPAADTYEVRVNPDRAPSVTWLHPRAAVETTPRGRVPLLLVAQDDHGVADLELEIRLPDGTVRAHALRPWGTETAGTERAPAPEGAVRGDPIPATDGPYGGEEVRVYVPLDLEDLVDGDGRPIVAPSGLAARVVVRDTKGQIKEGSWTSVNVYAPVDLERQLVPRRSAIRTQVASVLQEQRARREQLAGLVGVPLADPEKDLLRTVQFAQAKIAQDVRAAVGGLLEIFNVWVYARLAAEGPNERVLAILDRWHRGTYGAPPSDTPLDETEGGGDPVFPYAVYDEILQAWRDKAIFDSGLLDRMLVVLDDAVEAAARRAPDAWTAATRAAAGEAPVDEALAAQDALLVTLDRVADAMRTWQSLNEVILSLRRILEEQEALNERLDPERSGG